VLERVSEKVSEKVWISDVYIDILMKKIEILSDFLLDLAGE
jgi:hypothetical protein